MAKPNQILDLEKAFGLNLSELKDGDITYPNSRNCYQLDESGAVLGLNLFHNKLKDISPLATLTSLAMLDLSDNEIMDISTLAFLTSLKKLHLNGNKLTDIAPLSKLNFLEILDLTANLLTDISPISKLTSVKVLHLGNNKLMDIFPITNLSNLNSLSLWLNNLTDIPSLAKLISLHKLDLSGNGLKDIAPLAALTSLTELQLSGNELTDIAPLAALSSLTKLNVSYNQLTDITPLATLTSLMELEVSFIYLTEIAPLSALTSLVKLHLSGNELTDISPLAALTSLKELNVSYNELADIQIFKEVVKINTIDYLRANNNPFVVANNLVLNENENHLEIIKVALKKVEEAELDDAIDGYLPVKVLMLGNHGSGKSSLVHYLNETNLKIKHDTTHILNVVPYKKQENGLSKALFYDFGGQDFYHGLYQAFLSLQALTMIMWQKNKDKSEKDQDSKQRSIRNFNVPYWLGLLKRNNINEQVFVIRTHKTKGDALQSYANADVKEEFFLDLEKEETLEITNIVKKSSLTHFQNVFEEYITENQKQKDINKPNKAKGKLSKKFYDFLLKIDSEGKKRAEQCVNVSTIRKWYVGIDKSRFDVEIEQLVLSGMILKYNDVVWLNPKALVEKVHKLFSPHTIGNGVVEESDFKKLVTDDSLLGLLEVNKVIFKHEYGLIAGKQIAEYIIPNYLPLIESSGIDYDLMVFGMDNPLFILKYQDFMPFGLINHLICHFGRNPDRKKFWRDQLVFTISENGSNGILIQQVKILIKLNFDDLKIEVYAFFKEKDNSLFRQEIIEYVFYSILSFERKMILGTFNNFKNEWNKEWRQSSKLDDLPYVLFNKLGQVLSETNGNLNYKDFFNPYSNIFISLNNTIYIKYTELLENGSKTFIQSYHEDLSIYKEHAAYPYQPFTPVKIEKMKKVFISYSNQDHHYKETLLKHLKPLKQFQLIKPWSCEEMTTGNWHNQIQKELSEADVVIFMMSIDFITSDYILREEVYKTFEDIKNNKNKQVLCVLVKNFSWQYFASFKNLTQLSDSDFQKLQDANTLADLPTNQFIPYYIENKGEPNDKRYLKPINKWEYEEDAYIEVINQLVKVLS